MRVAHTYVMLHYREVILYVQRFEILAHVKYPHISESDLSKYWDRGFAQYCLISYKFGSIGNWKL